MKAVLSIAGSDCSGGAGIQADLKTMTVHGVYGMTAVTALTAQNTTGVSAVMEVTPDFLGAQLDAICSDIPPDAVKIGMMPSRGLAEVTAQKLLYYGAKNIVVDPVMKATNGTPAFAAFQGSQAEHAASIAGEHGRDLSSQSAFACMKERLFPLAALVTPNLSEAEALCGFPVRTPEEMERAARMIGEECGCAVLCKGGHLADAPDDLLYLDGKRIWYRGKRIDNPNTHGTGCTLSSAIASNLALGASLEDAVAMAKEYVTEAIASMLDLGSGRGPMNHMIIQK